MRKPPKTRSNNHGWMAIFPPVVELVTLVCAARSLVVYLGVTSNRSLEWKKADVFKINGDDDELSNSDPHLDKNNTSSRVCVSKFR